MDDLGAPVDPVDRVLPALPHIPRAKMTQDGRRPGSTGAPRSSMLTRSSGRLLPGWLLVTSVVVVLAAGCGSGGPRSSSTPSVTFPDTAAGRQARWLFGAAAHAPIPTAELTAHFDTAFLATTTPAELNSTFVGVASLRLDSITTAAGDGVAFVITADAGDLLVNLAVDAHGQISRLHLGPVPVTSIPPSQTSAGTSGVHSVAVGIGSPPLTAILTLPAAKAKVPGVVLVGGSGPSDEDETIGPDKPFLDLADGLAAQGIATLRYDKRTKDYPASIDQATFTPTQEYVPDAVAAINLLRSRPEIDPNRIFVLGHSQGGTFVPLIAQTDPQIAGVILAAAATEPLGSDLVRQLTYLSALPGTVGAQARAQLPQARQAEAEIESPNLATESPSVPMSPLLGGAGPTYWLNLRSYNEIATARAIPQPLLILQGDRDYQVTVAVDLAVWLRGLAGRPNVTVHRYPQADHAFIDGTGPPTPADYDIAGHVDPSVITDIAAWVHGIP